MKLNREWNIKLNLVIVFVIFMKKELGNLIGIVLIIVVFDIGVKWLFWKIFKYVVLKIFFNVIIWNENV